MDSVSSLIGTSAGLNIVRNILLREGRSPESYFWSLSAAGV